MYKIHISNLSVVFSLLFNEIYLWLNRGKRKITFENEKPSKLMKNYVSKDENLYIQNTS